jgi:ribosomal protein S18 acetylase RimI-like enzyme
MLFSASTPHDIPELQKVAESSFSSSPDSLLEEWFSFDQMEKYIEEGRGYCTQAVSDDGEIVGMVYAQQENPINGKEGLDKWVIVIVAVKIGVMNIGIGSALLKEMEQYVKARGASKLFVYTNKEDEKVVHFYHKNGYEDAGWIKDYQYGKGNSAVFLLKYL